MRCFACSEFLIFVCCKTLKILASLNSSVSFLKYCFTIFVDGEDVDPFNASDVMTAQRVIKNWIKETQDSYSIIPMEHLRTVFHVQTEHTPKLSQREFSKRMERNGIKRTRKRPVGADRSTTAIQGVEVSWNIDQEQYDYLLDSYFTEKDSKLLETMTH